MRKDVVCIIVLFLPDGQCDDCRKDEDQVHSDEDRLEFAHHLGKGRGEDTMTEHTS